MNLLMGASLLALAKSIYYFIVHSFTLFKGKPFKKITKLHVRQIQFMVHVKRG